MNQPTTTFTGPLGSTILVNIIRKRLDLDASLYTLLQILSVTLFEKMPLNQCLFEPDHTSGQGLDPNELNLFEY